MCVCVGWGLDVLVVVCVFVLRKELLNFSEMAPSTCCNTSTLFQHFKPFSLQSLLILLMTCFVLSTNGQQRQ